MSKVSIVKTLPHLLDLYISGNNDVACFTSGYSIQVHRFMLALQYYEADNLAYSKLISLLSSQSEYNRVNYLPTKQSEYSVTGDTLSLWLFGYQNPIRISFDGEQLESCSLYDQMSKSSLKRLTGIFLSTDNRLGEDDINQVKIIEDCQTTHFISTIFVNFKPSQAIELDHELFEFDYTYPPLFWGRMDILKHELQNYKAQGYSVHAVSSHWEELDSDILNDTPGSLLEKSHNEYEFNLPAGYLSHSEKKVLLTDREIFGSIYLRHKEDSQLSTQNKLLRELEGEIKAGDYIVHQDHGIGLYTGLTQELVANELREYLELEYADENKLLVPLDQISKLSKYIGPEGMKPALSQLGKASWKTTTKATRKAVTILARELVEHYARRELATAMQIDQPDSKEYLEFIGKFKFTETQDQLKSISEVLTDIAKPIPMNRLLVGDVGFGKTEVILRATFKAVESGGQVAILCPTTVLAAQHYSVFKERFKDSRFKVSMLSRLQKQQGVASSIEEINTGESHILIGTHRILSRDIKFRNLGMIIVDEEQRFGVRQKEKLKLLNYGAHLLMVSATPIPRTLSLALSGMQDISLITQPPKGRKPIETILTSDWSNLRAAISRELERGGQVYFLHNSVATINSIKAKLNDLLPGSKIIVAHGQLSPSQLEKAMTDFYDHKADILLCTTIIENGLDMPNVNTMIVNQARKFGLSQLYQLRGRIGRSQRQAYCYLMSEKPAEGDQRKKDDSRLQAIMDSNQLGAGFSISSKDLEIRGAGEILGNKQHGQINKVGYSLYMRLLNQEIERLKNLKDISTAPEFVSI